MIKHNNPVLYTNGQIEDIDIVDIEGKRKTLAYGILQAHNQSDSENDLAIRFDSLTSHDITYVSIIQTARASGMTSFPIPYVLTNCHNSLCAVGGTINEDDHVFALSAAHRYGGIYVPKNYAVIHSYNREMMTGCGRMILGSDSHTRYGALGTMGIGEGGGELAKQLVNRTYDISMPEIVLVHVTGKPKPGVGPHDVALSLVKETYDDGFVKNRVMEFVGEGIHNLSQDYRNAIDVMTTETTCLSSIWECDEVTKNYFKTHQREDAYKELKVADGASYDRCIELKLDEVECMIALPMHPSLALPINELKKNPKKYLQEAQERMQSVMKDADINLMDKVDTEGNIHVDQGIIAGCSGGIYENIVAAQMILENENIGNGGFDLSVYPDSMPSYLKLLDLNVQSKLIQSGAVIREAFCGPCFGAGETPSNNALSIRHTTRNFPNREGSKPTEGQASAVCLMDARSIATTAKNHGILTAASDVVDREMEIPAYSFDASIYENRVYDGFGKADPTYELIQGPNIKDWPEMEILKTDVLTKVVTYIDDAVTTTDELIPSGETSSYRSNPIRLAEFTLSRRDPDYVQKAKDIQGINKNKNEGIISSELQQVLNILDDAKIAYDINDLNIGSSIYANKPGDGSAREQAASCQRVLGAVANFAKEYATKRYRSNCINWGILPFVVEDKEQFKDAWVLIKNVREAIVSGTTCKAYIIKNEKVEEVDLQLGNLTEEEKKILLAGSLINYYKESN